MATRTVTLRKGQKYIVDVVVTEGQVFLFFNGASGNTQVYRFCFDTDGSGYVELNQLHIEEDLQYQGEKLDYLCGSDGRPIVFYTEKFIGKTYRIVWTALEDCTVELGVYRIY